MSHLLSHAHTKSPRRLNMARFALSHFCLPHHSIELGTAQFWETASAVCMHVGPWLWPSRLLWGCQGQECVLASPPCLHGRTVPGAVSWGGLGAGGCAQAAPRCGQGWNAGASPQVPQRHSFLSGDADALQRHPQGFAEPRKCQRCQCHPSCWECGLQLSRLCWLGAGSMQIPGCSQHASLCPGSHVPAQSSPLCAARGGS